MLTEPSAFFRTLKMMLFKNQIGKKDLKNIHLISRMGAHLKIPFLLSRKPQIAYLSQKLLVFFRRFIILMQTILINIHPKNMKK